MRYRDGLPLEWKVTLFYVCAATVLTVAIIAADYQTDAMVAITVDALREEIASLKETQCDHLPLQQ